jgi:PAS domain S-box-containing protein
MKDSNWDKQLERIRQKPDDRDAWNSSFSVLLSQVETMDPQAAEHFQSTFVVMKQAINELCDRLKPQQTEGNIPNINLLLEPQVEQRMQEMAETVQQLQYEMAQRQQSQFALQQAYQVLNFHVNNSPLAMIEWNSHMTVSRWSNRATEVFGWSADEVMGRSLNGWKMVYEEDIERVNRITAQLLEGAETCNFIQNRNYCKDGRVIHCEWYNSVLRDEAGNVISILSLALDVTERVEAEILLRQSQERYRLATQAARVGVWEIHLQTQEFYLDPNIKEVLGYRGDEIPNDFDVWVTYVHPDDREAVMQAVQAHLDGHTSECVYEHRMLHKDGSLRWILVRGMVLRDTQGVPLRFIGTNSDITKIKRAEEALLDSEAQFRRLAENVPGMIYRYMLCPNSEAALTYVSPHCQTIYELDPVDAIANPQLLWDRVHPDDIVGIRQAIAHSARSRQPFESEFRIVLPGDRTKWLYASSTAEYCPDGTVLWDGVMMDITARKLAEQRLQDSQDFLEKVINTINDPIFVQDENQRWLLGNAAFCETHGLQPSRMSEQIGYDFLSVENAETIRQNDEWVLKNGQERVIEESLTDIHQNYRVFSTKASCFQDSSGKKYLVGYSRDITEQKQAETALRHSEIKNRTLISALPDLVMRVSGQGEYLDFFSTETFHVFGSRDLIGQNVLDGSLPHYLADQRMYFIQQALLTHQIQVYEQEIEVGADTRTEEVRIGVINANEVLVIVRDITDRKRAEDQLRVSLHEKEVLLAEIHHRVKNNLQVVSSLLYLQASQIDDPQIRVCLEDSRNRIDSMALVHETLYSSHDFSKVNFAEYLQSLIYNLVRTYSDHASQVRLSLDVPPEVALSIDQAIPCGLIVNELVTNAFKHGFKHHSSGDLWVTLSIAGNAQEISNPDRFVTLTVGNTGVSLSPDFDPLTTRSMGIRLVTTLVSQLEGTLSLHRTPATVFEIRFPAAGST